METVDNLFENISVGCVGSVVSVGSKRVSKKKTYMLLELGNCGDHFLQ